MKSTVLIFLFAIQFAFGSSIALKDSKSSIVKSNENHVNAVSEVPIIGQIPVVGPVINGVIAAMPKPIPKRIEFDVPFPLSLFG